VNPGNLAGRLERLRASEGDLILVATDSADGVVGWLHAHLVQYLESEFRVEIGGLVVAARFQRRGVGRKLVDSVIPWATRHGAIEMSVRCQTWRVDAHGFYESLGFVRTKSQQVFRRSLSAA
jgi:GNAT superfamily N-acetyltransferase